MTALLMLGISLVGIFGMYHEAEHGTVNKATKKKVAQKSKFAALQDINRRLEAENRELKSRCDTLETQVIYLERQAEGKAPAFR